MKQLISAIIVLVLFSFGCSEVTTPVSPGETSPTAAEVNWVGITSNANINTETLFSTSKLIDGKTGGSLYINEEYRSFSGYCMVFAEMQFEPNSFEGERLISLTIDDQSGNIDCSPSGEFLIPALYNLTIEGMNFDGIDTERMEFVYMTADGKIEPVKYKSLRIHAAQGKLILNDALIPHFSRFGFVK